MKEASVSDLWCETSLSETVRGVEIDEVMGESQR